MLNTNVWIRELLSSLGNYCGNSKSVTSYNPLLAKKKNKKLALEIFELIDGAVLSNEAFYNKSSHLYYIL